LNRSRAEVVKMGRMVTVTLATLQIVRSTVVGKAKFQALRWIVPERMSRTASHRQAGGAPFGSSMPPLASEATYHACLVRTENQ
jgi:hypothetical protein